MQPSMQALEHALQAKANLEAAKDLDSYRRAVDAWQQLLANYPAVVASPVARGEVLANLGIIHLFGSEYDGNALDEAIRCLTSSLDSINLPMVALELGRALAERYTKHGNPDDLDAAIDRLSLATTGTETDQDYYLGELALAFIHRFRLSDNITDLTAAIQTFSAAQWAAPPGSLDQLRHMTNLGKSLMERGHRLNETADFQRSIEVLLKARAMAESGSMEKSQIFTALGAAYGLLGRRSGQRSDLNATVEMTEAAIQAVPASSDQSELLANLARALSDRFQATGARADLDRSIELLDNSLKAALPSTRSHAMRLHALALVLTKRADMDVDPAESLADWRRAVECFRASRSSASSGSADLLMPLSRDWLIRSALRQDWSAAAEAAVLVVAEMRLAFLAQGSENYQRQTVRSISNVSTLAAFALARVDEAKEAVTALDQGRARLLTAALERDRADMARLAAQGHADLAEEYRRLAAETITEQELGPSTTLPDVADRSSQERRLRLKLQRLLARIREVPGYEHFREPASYSDIAATAGPGPLVYLMSTQFGGLALIVRSTGEPPSKVIIPGLSGDRVLQRLTSYDEAYSHRIERPQEWARVVNSITRWSFDEVLGPAINDLIASNMVLIPCGALALLPLHAAWSPDRNKPSGRRYLLDEMTITYAANAQSLAEAQRLAARGKTGGVLVVEDPRPTELSPLPSAAYEAAAVLARFPADQRRHLRGEDATRQAVTSAMQDAMVWHFACHAMADTAMPLSSHIVLAGNDRFTVDDILRLRRADFSARLVVLSACSTGIIGVDTPDEVVGLPTALLQAGVAGAVASLWPVEDRLAALLSAEFYRRWRGGEANPAAALRAAQVWLRDADQAQLHNNHPELVPPPPAVSRTASRLVATAPTPYADPVNWAAFSYWGA